MDCHGRKYYSGWIQMKEWDNLHPDINSPRKKKDPLHKWMLFSWLLQKKVSKRLPGKTFLDVVISSCACNNGDPCNWLVRNTDKCTLLCKRALHLPAVILLMHLHVITEVAPNFELWVPWEILVLQGAKQK